MPEECLKEGNASHFLARAIPLVFLVNLRNLANSLSYKPNAPPFFSRFCPACLEQAGPGTTCSWGFGPRLTRAWLCDLDGAGRAEYTGSRGWVA
jgi:hypothetical protein